MRTEWPSEDTLAQRARSCGFDLASSDGARVQSAVTEFEVQTGWQPFLAKATRSLRLNPPRYWRQEPLILATPFAEAPAIYSYWDNSAETGTLLVEGTDYELVTHSFAGGQEAYVGVRFLTHPGTAARSIRVVGTAGAVTEIPDDVWEAVLEKALADASGQFMGAADGPVKRSKSATIEIEYGLEGGRGRHDAWLARFAACVQRNRREFI